MNFSTFSFASAGLVFAGAGLWALRAAEVPLRSWRVRGALFATAIWAVVLLPEAHGPGWRLLPAAELARYAAWLLAAPALLDIGAKGSFWPWRLNLSVWVAASAIAYWSPAVTFLLLAVTGFLNVELLLRSARPEEQRGTKLCAIGLGGMFASDLFIYTELALRGSAIGPVWQYRGLINALLLPFLIIGMQRLTKIPNRVFVSRHVAFYSTVFLSVGFYLMVVALAAQYLRGQAGVWSEWLQPLLLLGSGLVLAVLLATQSPWRKLRVFLAKHFYRNKYDYRVEWLRFVATLAEHQQKDARITSIRAIAQIFESPGGVLFQRDEGSGAYVSAAAWATDEQSPEPFESLPPSHDMVRFIADREWVIDLDEYRSDPAIYRSIELPRFLLRKGSSWRLVSPLFERENLHGFIVLRRPPDPFTMTFEDRDLLGMVGRHVATLLAQQIADRRLAESRQFDAFNRFVAFVMHDLKNSAAQLQLLASNATRHRNNPEFIDDVFTTIVNTSARITRLIAQLQSRDARAGQTVIEIGRVLQSAVKRCGNGQPQPEIRGSAHDVRTRADPERLTAVFEHILRNAQDAAGEAGKVWILVEHAGTQIVITIGDTGSGMDAEFVRDRLFRPFDSTKGSRGMGIGAYQAREYIQEIGGTIEVQSTPGSGTKFIVRLLQCQTVPSES